MMKGEKRLMGGKYDVIIVGAGPAGVAAALTACRRNKTVAVIGNSPETTALYKAKEIINYPGISGSGAEMMEKFLQQMSEVGAEYIHGKVLNVMPLGKSFGVAVGNDFYEAKAVILATGYSRLPICEGETEFVGRGVSYCATCDGMLYREKNVAVIGDSREAEEDAEFLRSLNCTVHKFSGREKIEIKGDKKADTIVVDGAEYKTDCIFILKDTMTVDSLVSGLETDGPAVVVNRSMETNIRGIYAAGDCTGSPRQVVKAVGEGNVAAISAVKYIDNLEKGE